MIHRNHKDKTNELECDDCGKRFGEDFPVEDFRMMIDVAKDEGWVVIMEDGEWTHHCPSCVG